MRYQVTVSFQGTAVIEVEAETTDRARLAAADMTLVDLARSGAADLLSYKCAAREIKPATLTDAEPEAAEDGRPAKPRPSGWYRPA